MNNKKKILAAAGILILSGAAVMAFYIWKKNKTQVAASVSIIGGADGPTSIFLPVNLTIPPMKEQKPQFWTSGSQKNSPMVR